MGRNDDTRQEELCLAGDSAWPGLRNTSPQVSLDLLGKEGRGREARPSLLGAGRWVEPLYIVIFMPTAPSLRGFLKAGAAEQN